MKNKIKVIFSGLMSLLLISLSIPLNAMNSQEWYEQFFNSDVEFELLDENLNNIKWLDGTDVTGNYEEILEYSRLFLDVQQQAQNGGIQTFGYFETYDQASYLSNNGYIVTVPFIRNMTTMEVVSCLNFDAEFPPMSEYEGTPNPIEDDLMSGAFYYGYGGMDNSLQVKYGISDSEAIYARGIVVWRHAKRLGIPGNTGQTGFYGLSGDNNLIDYINELASKTASSTVQDFNINFDGVVSQTNPQKTNPMGINANLGYTVDVTSPGYVTDLNGNKKINFNANEEFIVNAPPNYIGNIKVTVNTEQFKFDALMFKAKNEYYQNVAYGGISDPIVYSKEVNLDFKGALGKVRFKKEVDQNTTSAIVVDPTAHKVRLWNDELGFDKTYNITSTWFSDWDEVIIGTYDYEEITWDGNTRRIDYKGKITIEPQAEITQTIINEPKQNDLELVKEVENPTSDPGNKDYSPTDNLDKIKMNVKGKETHFTYNHTHNLDANGYKKLEKMNAGMYDVQETFVPDDMEINNTVQTVEVKDSETAKATVVHVKNKSKWSKLNIHKRDNNTGYVPNVTYAYASSLMKDAKGIPTVWTWDIANNKHVLAPGNTVTSDGTYYNRIDETTIIGTITTTADKDNETDAFLYGYKTVYVQEMSVPSTNHILINRTVKTVTLKPNETVTVEFLNILKDGGVIQLQKKDEDGNFLEWYFPVYKINEDKTETYVETIVTSKLNGIGNSTFLQFVEMDSKGNARDIDYKVCEQAHPLYKPQKCVVVNRKNAQPNTSVIVIEMMNYFKEMQFVLPKVAEKNVYEETADGSKFEIFNTKTKEVYATGTAKDDLVIFSLIRVDKIVNNEYLAYREIEQAEHFEKNDEIYSIPVITEDELLQYTSGQYYYLKPKDDPFVNVFKEITIGTRATTENGGKIIQPNTIEVIVDEIDLCNAVVGRQYTFVGVAMDKRTGELLETVNGIVREEKTFIAKGGCEVVSVYFEIDTTGFTEDIDIVFFEYLYYNPEQLPISEDDEPIAEHTDIDDEDQTIQLRIELPETGQSNNILLGTVLFIFSIFTFVYVKFRTRKKGVHDVKIH